MPIAPARGSRVKFTPLLAAAAVALATFAVQASAARNPTLLPSLPSTSGRSLLGAGVAPPPPPPIERGPLGQLLTDYVGNLPPWAQGLIAASRVENASETPETPETSETPNVTRVNLPGSSGFNLTSASTPFVLKLMEAASIIDTTVNFTYGDVIPTSIQQALCDSNFLRGSPEGGYDAAAADVAYAAAHPLNQQGAIPVVGQGWFKRTPAAPTVGGPST